MKDLEQEELINEVLAISPEITKIRRKIRDMTFKDEPVSMAHAYLLKHIKAAGTCTTSDLSKKMFVSKPNVTVLVDKLIELNMVRRTPDKNDRRVIFIELTDEGNAYGDKLQENMKSVLQEMFGGLEEEDILRVKEILKNIKILLNKTEE